jgi:hypothetical protein
VRDSVPIVAIRNGNPRLRKLEKSKAERVTTTEGRIAARLDALRHNRGSQGELGQLIRKELARTPAREQDRLLGYFERWLDRQLEMLLEESSPATRTIQ